MLGREVPPSGSPNVPDGFLPALRSLLVAPLATIQVRPVVGQKRRLLPIVSTHGRCEGPLVVALEHH